jgi:anti-anti-sigma regulatory factor
MLNVYKHTRSNGHRAVLLNLNEEVMEVFAIGGFLQLFKTAED